MKDKNKKISTFYMKELLRLESNQLRFLQDNKNRILEVLKTIDHQINAFENIIEYIDNYLKENDENY